uniref:EF-hand domain-containing protein n=1 Tax=Haptolina ericina TaxID=156174 RepID=A0A7S3B373_9EUKA
MEVFLVLLAFKLVYPHHVHLSRGNHESRYLNQMYGFDAEVVRKYSFQMIHLISDTFQSLPLAHVVGGRVLVLHGGLFSREDVLLEDIRRIDRRCEPPDQGIMCELLWSDPQPQNGRSPNPRGVALCFGPDVTERFLSRNGLDLLVRSHQVKSQGYEVEVGGKCITVFSASNYGGSCYNAGAILQWENGEVDAHEFIAPDLEKLQAAYAKGPEEVKQLVRRYSSRGDLWEEEVGCAAEPSHVARLDGEIARMIKERILRNKSQLGTQLRGADEGGTGTLSEAAWARVMASVLKLDIDFSKVRAFLTDLNDAGDIDYESFLNRYQVRLREQYAGWQHNVLQMFYNSLLAADLEITELLSFLDSDGDGSVSLHECIDALNSLKLGLSYGQIKQLVTTLGFDPKPADGKSPPPSPAKSKSPSKKHGKDGKPEEQNIPVERYLQRLTLVADTVRPKSEQEKHDLETVAKWIRTMCTSSGKGIADIFKEWDADSDGFIDYEEFIQCCIQFQDGLEEEADYTYTEEDFEEIAKVIDTAKAGRINYLAFLGLFQVLSEEGDGKARAHMANQAVIEHICSTIWANEVLLSKAFRLFDPQQTGLLAPADFHSALASLNEVLSRDDEAPITSKQIDELVNALPLDAKGKVNYKEFMNAFEVVDLAVEV